MDENNNFRKDLSNLVTNVDYFTDLTSAKVDELDSLNAKYETFINDILADRYKLDNDQIDEIGDTEEKLNYIKDNIWKLKPASVGQMTEKSYYFGEQKFNLENEIRNDLESLYKSQDEVIKENKEILESFHNDLLADKEIVNTLNAEIKQLEQEIVQIDSSLVGINEEISIKESEIEGYETQINENKQKINDKEADSLEADNEISKQKLKKQKEQLEINNLTAEKKEIERQLNEAKRELENAKKKDPKGNHSSLKAKVKDLEDRNSDILKDINNARTNINTIDSLINDQISRKTSNEKSIKQLNDENRNKENTLNNARKERTYKLTEKSKKNEMKIDRQGKIASNKAAIASYKIAKREKEYKQKFEENNNFVSQIYKNREEIKKKFKEYKIPAPNSKPIVNEQSEETPDENSENADKAQENAAKSGAGGGAQEAGGASVPTEEAPELTSRELAKNFANDVTRYGVSPEELRQKLNGYGYATFVNAYKHLRDRDRRKILKMLQERGNEVSTSPRDEMELDDILGDGAYSLIMENGYPRDLGSLNTEELQQLRKIIDNYTNNILDFDNDQIKVIEEKFLDTLANSALIEQYSKGKIKSLIHEHFVGDELLRREILGSMKFYNKSKADRFGKVVEKGNQFFENLHREKNPVILSDPATTNVPELSHSRSALQDEFRNRNR